MFKDSKQICLQKTSRQPICYRSGESSALVPSYTRTALVSFLNVVIFLCQGTLPCHPIQSVRSQEWCPVDLPRNPGASSSLLTACCQKIPWCTGNENEGTRHKLMVMIYDNDNIMKIPQVIEAVLDVFVKSHLYVPLINKKRHPGSVNLIIQEQTYSLRTHQLNGDWQATWFQFCFFMKLPNSSLQTPSLTEIHSLPYQSRLLHSFNHQWRIPP